MSTATTLRPLNPAAQVRATSIDCLIVTRSCNSSKPCMLFGSCCRHAMADTTMWGAMPLACSICLCSDGRNELSSIGTRLACSSCTVFALLLLCLSGVALVCLDATAHCNQQSHSLAVLGMLHFIKHHISPADMLHATICSLYIEQQD